MPESHIDQELLSHLSLPVYLYKEGTNRRAYEFLGAHPAKKDGRKGWQFLLWAPAAEGVSIVGEFNGWKEDALPMTRIHDEFWYAFSDGIREFDLYKYAVRQKGGKVVLKSDPFAFHSETRPGNASKTYDVSRFAWGDGAWMRFRKRTDPQSSPMNIYELHPGSWKTYENGKPFSYRKLAEELIPYIKSMGYTHLELMPVSEYPLDDSWGYQVTGYYAPTSRYGEPKDFMYFVDACHKAGIGVFVDWVGAHFPKDEYGLYEFDGTRLYEYGEDWKAEHPEWTTRVFDHGKNGVRSFLISNVIFWLEVYHVDGIRIDAVSSMLYLDYARKAGEWFPNENGGNENRDSIAFLRLLNDAVHEEHPDALTMAEEATSWWGVTADTKNGGLGFDFKWNMGWMHDTLDYLKLDPYFRKDNHDKLTFSMSYAFSEHYILPLSHDEVVHGKLSLINKMAGLYNDKFSNLRLLFAYMMAHPGKKLSFMGNEIAQFIEWAPSKGLDYFLLQYPSHNGFHTYMRDLNFFYLEHEAFWQNDCDWGGYQWISPDDRESGVIAFRRIADDQKEIIAVLHFTPVERRGYRLGVPSPGVYREVFTSNKLLYGGTGLENPPLTAEEGPMHGLPWHVTLDIPPLSALFFEVQSSPESDPGGSSHHKLNRKRGVES